jgi:DNA helicase HerA-like ATPase
MPSYRLKQIEKIVRLIRSKGIGLYFITHYTVDIPDTILSKLGNRVQHNLRAYTPADQKIAKAAADSFRVNSAFKTYDTILELGTGEALVSFQNEKGEPEVVEKVTILPPQSQMGSIDDSIRLMVVSKSAFMGKYDTIIDRESAFEILSKEMEEKRIAEQEAQKAKEEKKLKEEQEKEQAKAEKEAEKIRKDEEKAKKEEERIRKEEERAEEKARKEEERIKKELEKEAEKERKNSWQYKVGKQAERTANSTINSVARKVANNVLKNLFGLK